MVKVLHIIWRWDGGGIETFLSNLMSQMGKSNVHFDFVVFGAGTEKEKSLTESGAKVYHIPEVRRDIDKLHIVLSVSKILRKSKYDIVHSHLSSYNIFTMLAAKLCGVKVRISHVHNVGCERKESFKYCAQQKLMGLFATDFIACSQDACDYYFGQTKIAKVVYCGVDMNRFSCMRSKKNPSLFAIVGRYCEEKNPEFIKQLIVCLHKINKDYKFIWCGVGEMSESIKEYFAENGVEDSIEVIGYTNNVPEILERASYMLLPSISEGLPLSMLEAQCSGTFVFASDIITKEADLGYAKFFSLDLGCANWANLINEFIVTNQIDDFRVDAAKMKEFDIRSISDRLLNDYYMRF